MAALAFMTTFYFNVDHRVAAPMLILLAGYAHGRLDSRPNPADAGLKMLG